MASVTAVVRGVQLLRGDDDVIGSENANFKTRNYAISIDAGGTAVTGGTDTLDLAVATALTGNERNGKTVTLRAACVAKCARDTTNGTSFAGTLSLSGNTISLTPKSNDWSTNANIASGATLDRPFVIHVTVNEA